MTPASPNELVLVVDDDDEVRDALRATLEGAGYAVATASGGSEAFAALRGGCAPRLILLDLSMPDGDGWTFLELRRADPAVARVPIVLVSGRAGPTRESPYVGVAAIVAKPCDPAVLLRVVARVIDAYR